MALETISGKVSNIRQSTETTGSSGKHGGSVATKQILNFRVDNRPVTMKLMQALPDISDGEQVTVAGENKGGSFEGWAVRNDETGAVYADSSTGAYFVGTLAVIMGIPLTLIYIGVVLIGFGAWLLYKAKKNSDAIALLQAA